MDENIKALFDILTYEQMTRNSAKDLAVSDFLCTFASEKNKKGDNGYDNGNIK